VSPEHEKKLVGRASDDVAVELHDWHPTSNRIVDGTNDHNILAAEFPLARTPIVRIARRKSYGPFRAPRKLSIRKPVFFFWLREHSPEEKTARPI
jgi:hypothetical protein